jgi:glucose-6-phosphate isomerase
MMGKWYRQLMRESIGKEHDKEGNVAHIGITPMVSIGSTDLHSMAQLYFGGPRDKFTCFVSAPQEEDVAISQEQVFLHLVEGIQGKTFAQIMEAIMGGVRAAYQKNELPYVDIALPEISEVVLGQYLQFRMMEMMFLAQFLNVNAFDQPNVEDYKAETRKLLV